MTWGWVVSWHLSIYLVAVHTQAWHTISPSLLAQLSRVHLIALNMIDKPTCFSSSLSSLLVWAFSLSLTLTGSPLFIHMYTHTHTHVFHRSASFALAIVCPFALPPAPLPDTGADTASSSPFNCFYLVDRTRRRGRIFLLLLTAKATMTMTPNVPAVTAMPTTSPVSGPPIGGGW